MKFENFIKKLSSYVAMTVVFLMAGGMYLSFKGFAMNSNGTITLVTPAEAAEAPVDIKSIGKPLPKNVLIPYGHTIGSKTAPVTLYEYSSFGCYHCANFHLKTLPKLKPEFIDTGKVKVVFVDFPLDKTSLKASLASNCFSGEKYRQYLDKLFNGQRSLQMTSQPEQILKKFAAEFGVNEAQIEQCLQDIKYQQEIMDNRQYAIKHLGIQGTPSFVISSLKDRRIIYGAPNYETMKAILEHNLSTK